MSFKAWELLKPDIISQTQDPYDEEQEAEMTCDDCAVSCLACEECITSRFEPCPHCDEFQKEGGG